MSIYGQNQKLMSHWHAKNRSGRFAPKPIFPVSELDFLIGFRDYNYQRAGNSLLLIERGICLSSDYMLSTWCFSIRRHSVIHIMPVDVQKMPVDFSNLVHKSACSMNNELFLDQCIIDFGELMDQNIQRYAILLTVFNLHRKIPERSPQISQKK